MSLEKRIQYLIDEYRSKYGYGITIEKIEKMPDYQRKLRKIKKKYEEKQ